tara:strand:+ start:3555 stop:3977 length:423 start_codon:yes stop_codon:yes gene_type:complete
MDTSQKGIKELSVLIESMEPILHDGDYIFTMVENTDGIPRESTLFEFKEQEGITLVMTKEEAEKLSLPYSFITAWITLSVQSSLDAVGFTAAFSTALARNGISCNVVAGYFHDHIFVNKNDKDRALKILLKLSEGKIYPE